MSDSDRKLASTAISRLAMAITDHSKAIQALLAECSRHTGRRTWEVFSDWVEVMALAIANSFIIDPKQHQEREERYAHLQEKHGEANIERFTRAFAHLVSLLEDESTDALGRLYMQLGLGDKSTAQFFTPYGVSKLMASMLFDEETANRAVSERGYVTVSEPACGAGGMLIAFAENMRKLGLNPQSQMHATAVDVDITAVHMAYVQLSLLGIPAVVVHGDALKLEERSHWITPMHHAGLWHYRLQREPADVQAPAAVVEQPALFEVAT